MSIKKIIEEYSIENKISLTPIPNKNLVVYKIVVDKITEFLSFLKNKKILRFNILTDLFATDFPERTKRFEIVYNLLSLKINSRIIIKTEITENEKIQSIIPLFNAACWYEREIFDMFGIIFEGNNDRRRLLTDYGFIGHPLRKDFPLTGHLQVKYNNQLEKVIYEPILLDQEFRNFDFVSPWKGEKKNNK